MNRLLIAAFALLLSVGCASAQSTVRLCFGAAGSCPLVTSVNPLPVTGTFTPTALATVNVPSAALVANQVIVASAASLYSFNVSADSTLSAAAWWIMIYNATTAPGDGAVTPARCYAMTSGTTSFSAAFPVGLPFATGITIGVSTTGCFTKTASTHAFIAGDYK